MADKRQNDPDLLPTYSVDLIKELDEAVPPRCPDPSWSERTIWMYAGKRELIAGLLSRKEYSEENALGQHMEK